ncbi:MULTISPECIES: hypothetical protein [unclassified Kribbella]|uniref:hypothetical protein n=1 Tax=unclassified Kribbella TaxID=2644121 RepID=UPI003019B082
MSKESIGSVAEEAAKLFAVLQNAADSGGTAHAEHEPADQEHEHKAGPECQWCPVCQLINKVRNTSPETIEQLSTAAAHVLGSVRSLLEAAAEAARQSREDAASRSDQQQEEPSRSRVDRIDVSEDPEPWD